MPPQANKESDGEVEVMSDGDPEQPLGGSSPIHEMDAAPIPHSYNLAASMGVSSHKVQVMKASFFTDPSATGIHPTNQYRSPLSSQKASNVRRGLLLNSGTSPLFKQPFAPRLQQNQFELQQEESPFSLLSPSIPDLTSPPMAPAVVTHGLIPYKLLPDAITDCYRTCVNQADLGLASGRSFRTGWGLCWNFFHFGIVLSCKPHHKKQSAGLLRPLGLQKHLYSAAGQGDVVPFKINIEKLQSTPYLTPEELRGKLLSVSIAVIVCCAIIMCVLGYF